MEKLVKLGYDMVRLWGKYWPMYLGCGLWMLSNADAPGEPL